MWVLETCMGVHKGVRVRGILGTETSMLRQYNIGVQEWILDSNPTSSVY